MAKTNGLRKNFAHDFSKKHMVVCVCVCVCVCVSFPYFLVFEMGTTKKHETTFQKSQTLKQIIKNIAGAVTMCHDH